MQSCANVHTLWNCPTFWGKECTFSCVENFELGQRSGTLVCVEVWT
jgi:hypothetical protein